MFIRNDGLSFSCGNLVYFCIGVMLFSKNKFGCTIPFLIFFRRVLCGPRELANASLHQFSELGELGDSPSGGSCKSWDTRCVDQLFSGRSCRLGKKLQEVPMLPFQFLVTYLLPDLTRCRLVRSPMLGRQVGNLGQCSPPHPGRS